MQPGKDNLALLNPEILDKLLSLHPEMNTVTIGGDMSSELIAKITDILQQRPQVKTLELNEAIPADALEVLATKISKNPYVSFIYVYHEFSMDETIGFVERLSQTKNKKTIYFTTTNFKLQNILRKMLSQSLLTCRFIN